MSSKSHIEPLDYVILSLILAISIFIGIYHGFKVKIMKFFKKKRIEVEGFKNNVEMVDLGDSHNTKVGEYFIANSSLPTLPIAFSLLASFYSATALLGIPAEIYQYGIQYWLTVFCQLLSPLTGALITGPFFAKLKILSIFEYFELRFNSKNVRLIGMACYVTRNFISDAIFMYGPATSLSVITNLNEKVCIALIGSIGTFYTAIGGIKSVIWNDLFQALIMFTSLFVIVIKGIYDLHGFGNLWTINRQGGRLDLFDFNPDPFVRQTFWSITFGWTFYTSITFCFDQQMIQRFQASRTKRIAQRALILNMPLMFLIVSLCCLVGLIIYATYFGCDPLTNPYDRIMNPNQLVGYYVLNNLNVLPGITGLFLGSIFCGSLSSVSSYLNSQAAIIWEDFLKLFSYFKSFDDTKSLRANKIIVFVCGLLSTGLAFLISTLGGNLVQISTGLNGAFNAPIIGLFLLGLFVSITTPIGAITGTVCGFLFGLWITIGAYVSKPYYPKLNVSTAMCSNETVRTAFNLLLNETSIKSNSELTGFNKIYSLSYMLYTPFGVLVTVVVGVLVSLLTNGLKLKIKDKSFLYADLTWFCHKKEVEVENN